MSTFYIKDLSITTSFLRKAALGIAFTLHSNSDGRECKIGLKSGVPLGKEQRLPYLMVETLSNLISEKINEHF